jgi:hypothetical protein
MINLKNILRERDLEYHAQSIFSRSGKGNKIFMYPWELHLITSQISSLNATTKEKNHGISFQDGSFLCLRAPVSKPSIWLVSYWVDLNGKRH